MQMYIDYDPQQIVVDVPVGCPYCICSVSGRTHCLLAIFSFKVFNKLSNISAVLRIAIRTTKSGNFVPAHTVESFFSKFIVDLRVISDEYLGCEGQKVEHF